MFNKYTVILSPQRVVVDLFVAALLISRYCAFTEKRHCVPIQLYQKVVAIGMMMVELGLADQMESSYDFLSV